eukprot:m.75868 g.75868  ORF g.75868 m.75868 type:complete len:606 (+) comp8499_c0_seq2:385-2202(+)
MDAGNEFESARIEALVRKTRQFSVPVRKRAKVFQPQSSSTISSSTSTQSPPSTTLSTTIDESTSPPSENPHKKGIAPVKAEYQLPWLSPKPDSREHRGRNKKRPKPNTGRVRLCNIFKSNNECQYGDACKFSHDIGAFLASKEPDLKGECPFWRKQGGKCKYGVQCRFYGTHVPMSDEEIAEEKECDDLREKYEHNRVPISRSQALRSKNYPLPLTKAFVKEYEKAKFDDRVVEFIDQRLGSISDKEKKKIDWADKLYLAPLTTVGNLPFRVVCKRLGADITCGEMAMASNLLQGQKSELALLKRHALEDVFGVQICGNKPDLVTKCVEMLNREVDVDFVDLNCGCPIELVYRSGAGSSLLDRHNKLSSMVIGMNAVSDIPITLKIRAGISDKKCNMYKHVARLGQCGASMITVHGRSRQQRYSRHADWGFIAKCVKEAPNTPIYGNGDILSFEDALESKKASGVRGLMIARGALIKPWIFTEIKEERHWDISSRERFDMMKDFVDEGLQHWGCDTHGVETTRRFLLEWLSFTCRYIPVGLMERLPQRINERPPRYQGRNDLETLLASPSSQDWVRISEMLLGPTNGSFNFVPKHKANSYATSIL